MNCKGYGRKKSWPWSAQVAPRKTWKSSVKIVSLQAMNENQDFWIWKGSVSYSTVISYLGIVEPLFLIMDAIQTAVYPFLINIIIGTVMFITIYKVLLHNFLFHLAKQAGDKCWNLVLQCSLFSFKSYCNLHGLWSCRCQFVIQIFWLMLTFCLFICNYKWVNKSHYFKCTYSGQ